RFALELNRPWYVLMESAGIEDEDMLDAALMDAIESGLVYDAVIAKNRTEADEMWRLRHAISEAQKREGASLKHDVSVPVGAVARFIESATAAVTTAHPGVRVVAFGHVGDGNVHFNLSQPVDTTGTDFLACSDSLGRIVYDEVARFGGSFSAEHGVGQAKRDELRRYRSETEVTLMRTLKAALDPDGLLNPGKVI
ncbi:MAG: hydroxyacid dehydrogenase, partial [Gammaproteobacteria bacterium]|nr:hydroxyacid dehydrogenase [Gammaproteobacteria bacterium]